MKPAKLNPFIDQSWPQMILKARIRQQQIRTGEARQNLCMFRSMWINFKRLQYPHAVQLDTDSNIVRSRDLNFKDFIC